MLLTATNLSKSYGPRLLFSGITIGLLESQRVGLIGANGSGKSTLLRILAGKEQPDEGELTRRQIRTSYVAQEDTFPPNQSCIEIVTTATDSHLDDHERHLRAVQFLDRAKFSDPNQQAENLSGGWRKRLAIVSALAAAPDLLLMDEPTNHLDIEGILWLEKLLENPGFATLIVSHDRIFLESIANRIIELGRAYPEGFLSHNGSYTKFLEKREEFLTAQQGRQQSLASNVRREIEWLQSGAKARTTKAKGRIERAGEMMTELADLQKRNAERDAAKIDFAGTGRQTKKLIQVKNVAQKMGGRQLFQNVNFTLSPGSKLGLLGPNGSGKSTLIRLLSQQLPPDTGELIFAPQLRIVVFDQHREELQPTQLLRRALAPHGDVVSYQGSSMHISAWAKRFLFRTDQLDLPVSELSGGEQARVLIARLMLEPADVLILDEPTNDLDIPTLDVLETSLKEFPGALVLVTHDRYLLDAISTEILALDGQGNANMYADLAQWTQARTIVDQPMPKKPQLPARTPAPQKKRLTWNEQKELESMEDNIHKAEAETATLQTAANDPTLTTNYIKARDVYEQLAQAQREVERLYNRWAELESRK